MSYHRRACCWRGMTRLRITVAQTATNCHWTTEIIPGTRLAAFCTAAHAFFAALCPIRLMILKSYSTVVKPVPTKFTMSLRAKNTESRLNVPRAKLLQAVEPLFAVWTPKSWILCKYYCRLYPIVIYSVFFVSRSCGGAGSSPTHLRDCGLKTSLLYKIEGYWRTSKCIWNAWHVMNITNCWTTSSWVKVTSAHICTWVCAPSILLAVDQACPSSKGGRSWVHTKHRKQSDALASVAKQALKP